jgi:nucleotide-binding universal stress UspA family protein
LYKKILVPIDDSDCSKHALLEAIKIAKLTGGSITITNVHQAEPVYSGSKAELFRLLRQQGETILVNGKKSAQTEGFEVKSLLLEGDPVEQIVKTAKKDNFDLIVIGAGGSGKLSEFVLGSTSHEVIKKTQLPVLVVK